MISGGFFRSPFCKGDDPDVQVSVFPRVTDPEIVMMLPDPDGVTRGSSLIMISLLAPDARAKVEFDDDGRPQVVMGDDYLSSRDANVLAWGVQKVRSIVSNDVGWMEVFPGSSVVDNELVKAVKDKTITNSNWVGSNSIGRCSLTSVVSTELKVWGTSNLYVADSSVIPVGGFGNVINNACVVGWKIGEILAGRRLEWIHF
jgi:choline dehydrogenase-like flavoprotein